MEKVIVSLLVAVALMALCLCSAKADSRVKLEDKQPKFILCHETCQQSCAEKFRQCKQVEQCEEYTRNHCERDCWQECDKSDK